ncbi:MAG TPA: hypothetical protein VE153_13300 [Myxococcus sp.]|nr:hypothetical protein [Myxococcus sp.]
MHPRAHGLFVFPPSGLFSTPGPAPAAEERAETVEDFEEALRAWLEFVQAGRASVP